MKIKLKNPLPSSLIAELSKLGELSYEYSYNVDKNNVGRKMNTIESIAANPNDPRGFLSESFRMFTIPSPKEQKSKF